MNIGELKKALRTLDDTAEVWIEATIGDAPRVLDVLGEIRMENGDLHLVGEEAV